MKKIFLILVIALSGIIYSQKPFYQPVILCLAAHPDDEDGATLAYYSKLKGFKTVTIFYTRGEGGQNEIGPELYDELGKIREQECYDASEIQGSTAYFLGMLDFGFSKTAKETFKFWGGEDSVLARIVYMIRKIRPDVVITNHDTITTKPIRQHGHHQAVGITAYDAFEKAADMNYHPEQLVNGVTPWQVKKLFFRVYDTTMTNVIEIDISEKDATGKTIEEISFDALANHRTQGMDKINRTNMGVFGKRRYELIRSDNMYPIEGDDLFAGIGEVGKKPNFGMMSYPTLYNYTKINPEDSLRLLKSLKVKTVKIGLINTYDNTLEKTMAAFKIDFEIIDSMKFYNEDLKKYEVILLDIRTYLYRKDVAGNNQKLLDYISDGGNVICFYNKPGEWNGNNYAPYPIHLTNERVTEEDSKISILKNEKPNRYFTSPNNINENDWNDWIQERSIYLPSSDPRLTSDKYEWLLEMNDENDTVPNTSMLFANYGYGTYIYCSLALYRQLKIFLEGALKLFLNMISQPFNSRKIIY